MLNCKHFIIADKYYNREAGLKLMIINIIIISGTD